MNFSNAHKEVIKDLYERTLRTVDDLPYTSEFDSMHALVRDRTCCNITKHDFWRAISNLRKAGHLSRKER